MEPGKIYIRCMGGKRCNHAPGTCTASEEYQSQIAKQQSAPSLPELSLRDWLAGQALPAIIAAITAGEHSVRPHLNVYASAAADAYAQADAMLQAREQSK